MKRSLLIAALSIAFCAWAGAPMDNLPRRRAASADLLEKTGSLLPGGGSIVLEQEQPGKMLCKYLVAYLPEGTEALRLSWREKVTGLVKGAKPWFDARVICEFLGPDGRKMSGVRHPQPAYTQKDRPDYSSHSPENCPLCKAGVKLDALVNSYGISSL